MAAAVNTTVTGTLVDGAGAVIVSATVKAQRVDPTTLSATTMNAADTASATSNASTGIFSLTLPTYDIRPTTWKVTLPCGQYFYLPLPANAKSVGLGLLHSGRVPAKTVRDLTAQIVPGLKFIGQDLASAAALPEPTCDIHAVSGTTNVTSITATNFPVGKILTLTFAGILTFTDGGNISIASNYVTTAGDSITMYFDGTNFVELNRSGNV